jgi:hypothetical protein
MEGVEDTAEILVQIGPCLSARIPDRKIDLVEPNVMLLPQIDTDPTIRLARGVD